MIALDEILAFLKWVTEMALGHNQAKQERIDAAVKALAEALTHTRLYIADHGPGAATDRLREKAITERWDEAAQALRRVDANLAEIAAIKATYWTDPRNWSGTLTDEAAIAIDNLQQRYQALLNPGKKTN